MRLFWSYLKHYKKYLFLALFLATINQVFSLLDPQIFRIIVDRYATKPSSYPQNEFLSGVTLLILASIGVAFVSRVAKNFQDYYVNVITQRVGTNMYAASVAHSFSLPYSVFEDQRSGALLQKLQKARTDSQTFIISMINIVFLALVSILFIVGYAFLVHPLVGLVYFLAIPTLGWISFLITERVKGAQKKIVKETAELAGSTTETLRNVELVKSLGLDRQETERLNTVNEKILSLELNKIKIIRKLMFFQGTLINALRSGILVLMLWFIFKNSVTVGEFMTLFIYSFFVFTLLSEFGTVAANFQEARASLEQLEEVFTLPPEPTPVDAVAIPKISSIEFKNVSFSYASGSGHAVSRVHFDLQPGTTIAFAGPSGSGKSTLVKLLVGLYKPVGGTIKINGIDAEQINYHDFRKRIGYVAQETQLFAGTIRENLLFVKPDATDAECFRAIKMAAALPILDRANQGLDTKIGEGGVKISGGERQRLAIARALLRNPDLIIFDEATSSLDSVTEKEITKTIQEISRANQNLMQVIVAHRLSTIAHANTIYVLEKGKVIESGAHTALIKTGGLYSALYREQTATG